ncbi:MAG TPA: M15 family metallopeptidase [Marmoricola sp.]
MSSPASTRKALRSLKWSALAAGAAGLTLLGVLGHPSSAASSTLTASDADPAVANLDPALRAALRLAVADAADDGVALHVNSGWRSRAHQQRLLDEAVLEYGSRAEASRWVATPDTSPHVGGEAVDIGPVEASSWLARHGSAYGLCRIYANEPWHFELRPAAVDHGCPATYVDAAHDPRLQ